MLLNEVYRTIPYDLSGSLSKNRFRQEILWGVSKMFDLFDKPDFCIIFDYKCDIEVHLKDSIEFYQIKSQKAQRPYNFTELSKVDGTGSTIGKLFVLKDASCPEMRIKCALVWYVNLLKLKHEFNPDAIDFPVVFDSPNNAETDQEKKNQVYQYICERITDNQLIVSGIGFRDMPIPNVEFDKVIELDNPKYGLLIEKDYVENIGILTELNSK